MIWAKLWHLNCLHQSLFTALKPSRKSARLVDRWLSGLVWATNGFIGLGSEYLSADCAYLRSCFGKSRHRFMDSTAPGSLSQPPHLQHKVFETAARAGPQSIGRLQAISSSMTGAGASMTCNHPEWPHYRNAAAVVWQSVCGHYLAEAGKTTAKPQATDHLSAIWNRDYCRWWPSDAPQTRHHWNHHRSIEEYFRLSIRVIVLQSIALSMFWADWLVTAISRRALEARLFCWFFSRRD